MNLNELKDILYAYEMLQRELIALDKRDPDQPWYAITTGDFKVPLPKEYAEQLFQEHRSLMETRAKEFAAKLGIEFSLERDTSGRPVMFP